MNLINKLDQEIAYEKQGEIYQYSILMNPNTYIELVSQLSSINSLDKLGYLNNLATYNTLPIYKSLDMDENEFRIF